MKSILLASAIVIASLTAASADDMQPMHPMHGMHMMHHPHHHCVTVKRTVHRHGRTVVTEERSCS